MPDRRRPKRLAFSREASAGMLVGIDTLARVAGLTLGPRGRNVALVPRHYAVTRVVNRSDTIVETVELADPVQNLGVKVIRQAAAQTAKLAGDGSTTTVVLAHAMVREGLKNIAAGANPMLMRRGIGRAARAVASKIQRMARPLADTDVTAKLAATSSGSDEIGKVVAKAMGRVGEYGLITVERSIEATRLKLQYTKGVKYDRGYLSAFFLNDNEPEAVALDNPRILLTDCEIKSPDDLIPILESLKRAGETDLLVMAGDVEGKALTLLTANNSAGAIHCVAVRAPDVSQYRRDILQDLAIWTGGTFLRKEMGTQLPYLQAADLGRARKVYVDANETTIMGGRGDSAATAKRLEDIRREASVCDDAYQRAKMHRRVAQLTGGIAIIWYGGATDAERNDTRFRLEDALASTRAAALEGLVPGGGIALLNAATALDSLEASGDEATGISLVRRALEAPLRRIAVNANENGAVVLANIRRLQSESGDSGIGFDAWTCEYVDMWERGILDPAKSVRYAILNAASCAAMLLTTHVAIIDPNDMDPGEKPYKSTLDFLPKEKG